jgi:TPR repeat protein
MDQPSCAPLFGEPPATNAEPPARRKGAPQELLTSQMLAEQRKVAAEKAIFKFHHERATNGIATSQRRLAELYAAGIGCEKDTNAAAAWLAAAATNTPAK